ncbi:hypothetical protein FOA52_001101 [Chlamydomonas sp. UWO 241]|nr:hypothetical protein FOA52_001101 [Chlamydomonas sp. UWO 241]
MDMDMPPLFTVGDMLSSRDGVVDQPSPAVLDPDATLEDPPSPLTVYEIDGTAKNMTEFNRDIAMDENVGPELLTDVGAWRPHADSGPMPGPVQVAWDFAASQRGVVTLSYAVLIGGVVATSVFVFDVSISAIHEVPDWLAGAGIGGGRATGLPIGDVFVPFRCVMPVGAGFAVAWLQSLGFAPPLKMVTRAVENVRDDVKTASLPKDYASVFRKAVASAITLGSGASLGPEAPSVELGANTAAVITKGLGLSRRRQRMLIAAGAAAGVSAAFDAPVAGALFAVEFVLKSSRLGLDRLSTSTVFVSTSVAAAVVGFLRAKGQALGIIGASSHLVGRIPYFSAQPHLLLDVFQFGLLGAGCAGAAVALYEGVRVSEIILRPLPRWISAPLAGAACGAIALAHPQVQYGHVNLEEIFRDSTNLSLPSLLTAKHSFLFFIHEKVQYGYVNLEEIFRDSTNLSLPSLLTAKHSFLFFIHEKVQYGYVNLEEIFRDSTNLSLPSLLTAKHSFLFFIHEKVQYGYVNLEEIFRDSTNLSLPSLLTAKHSFLFFIHEKVQYGYVNLEEIFRDSTNLSVSSLVGLLIAKIAATSICVGGGLVGGLFAPSLFLGALVGDIAGHFQSSDVVDTTTFVVVGAAAVLGASCRAPLTALVLMIEITRDTGLLIPLLAAIGTASIVTDYLEGLFSQWLEAKLVEMYLKEKSMFWGASLVREEDKHVKSIDVVESAMSVSTSMYIRGGLPLQVALDAMNQQGVKAAVIVDDNFAPMGVAFAADIEEELTRQKQTREVDNNFGRR